MADPRRQPTLVLADCTIHLFQIARIDPPDEDGPMQNDDEIASLGRRLMERRQRLGLSQADVAQRLGIGSNESLSRYERGEREPRYSTLLKLADALECEPAALLPGGKPDVDFRKARRTLGGLRPLDLPAAKRLLSARIDDLSAVDDGLATRVTLSLVELVEAVLEAHRAAPAKDGGDGS
jgi:transcriptional regulator with XRE-family HTH domain